MKNRPKPCLISAAIRKALAYLDLYLPFCFDAATVWYRDKCVSTAGDMEDYDPTEYLDPYSKYEFYPNVIDRAPQYVTLSFPMTRDALYPDRFEAARVVTVHYRAEHGADFSKNLPLTGTNAALKPPFPRGQTFTSPCWR